MNTMTDTPALDADQVVAALHDEDWGLIDALYGTNDGAVTIGDGNTIYRVTGIHDDASDEIRAWADKPGLQGHRGSIPAGAVTEMIASCVAGATLPVTLTPLTVSDNGVRRLTVGTVGDDLIYVDTKYVGFLDRHVVRFKGSSPTGPVVASIGDQWVAIVMPMLTLDSHLLPDERPISEREQDAIAAAARAFVATMGEYA